MMKREYFSPEKLAVYFYSAICGIDYIHQKNMYYGDMKGANLLIFRDQKVKLGDLGISIKLDKHDDPTEQRYYLKGATEGYLTREIQLIYDNETEASRIQLFENDKHALIVTFTKALNLCNNLIQKEKDTSKLECMQIRDDLQSMSIPEVVEKWGNYFKENIEFSFKLCKQLLHENKPAGIREIYRLTRYVDLLEGFNKLAAKDPRNSESKVSPYNE